MLMKKYVNEEIGETFLNKRFSERLIFTRFCANGNRPAFIGGGSERDETAVKGRKRTSSFLTGFFVFLIILNFSQTTDKQAFIFPTRLPSFPRSIRSQILPASVCLPFSANLYG